MRLARHAGSCTPEGLALVMGPVLLEPQAYTRAAVYDPDDVNAAAVDVLRTLLKCAGGQRPATPLVGCMDAGLSMRGVTAS